MPRGLRPKLILNRFEACSRQRECFVPGGFDQPIAIADDGGFSACPDAYEVLLPAIP
jgi:hypothetical protein